ncbi:MAG: endolytic transglycosylase MltG [Clostridia bacterium]|nr:endolytic transglycosylase MltG [Clostridia bacterium]
MEKKDIKNTENGTSFDDSFVIGEGFSIDESASENYKIKKLKKRSRPHSGIKTVIWVISIIVVSVVLAFGAIFVTADYLGIGFGRGKDCVIEIDKGTPVIKIADKLQESGAVKIPVLFRLYSKIKHYESRYKYGVYEFNNELGYSGIAEMLMSEGAKADSVKVTVPEMASVDDIAKILEDSGVCKKADFLSEVRHGDFDFDFVKEIPEESVYYRLEGYLFPETYDFYSYDSKECAHLAVLKMLSTLDERIKPYRDEIKKSGYSFHEIMSMASLVELEAGGSPSEMSNVAAVFFNRLKSKKFDTLGSSPTRKYPYGNDRYNTYVCKGLPVGPLCSPSLNSIKATLYPTSNFEYYYFVTDASMKFYYNKTIKEHNATIAKLKAEKNWIYED